MLIKNGKKRQIEWKTAFVTVSFIMMWDSWPACERLGMCCVEEGPFPLNHMPLKIHCPPPIPPNHTRAHSSFLSTQPAFPPPHPAQPCTTPCLPSQTPRDNWHQLHGWIQCAGRGCSAGLTPHLTLAWPLACDSPSPKATLLSRLIQSASLSPVHTCVPLRQDTRPATGTSSGQLGQLNSNWG